MSALKVLRHYTTPNIHKDIDVYMGIEVIDYHRSIEWTNFNNAYHRIGHPAHIEWFADGLVRSEKWYQNGIIYRVTDKPSHVEYYNNNNTVIAEFWSNKYGRLDRDILP